MTLIAIILNVLRKVAAHKRMTVVNKCWRAFVSWC
jgi:hypothetical protein